MSKESETLEEHIKKRQKEKNDGYDYDVTTRRWASEGLREIAQYTPPLLSKLLKDPNETEELEGASFKETDS